MSRWDIKFYLQEQSTVSDLDRCTVADRIKRCFCAGKSE